MAKPTLPQQDSKAGQKKRKDEINDRRQSYAWELKASRNPYLKPQKSSPTDDGELPFRENFNTTYQTQIFDKTARIAANAALSAFQNPHARPGALDGYRAYYPYFQATMPQYLPTMRGVSQDKVFGHLRVAGPNPMVLRKVEKEQAVTGSSEITDEHFKKAFGPNRSIAQAAAEGRLFACDYAILHGRPWGTSNESGGKVVPSPFALFYADPAEDGHLMPGPIQAMRDPTGNRVFVPSDPPFDWLAAKLSLQVADAVHHEMVSHLGRTHFVVEPWAVAAERNFSVKHPLLMLLRPHLRFVIGINYDARKRLLAQGGYVDEILGLRLTDAIRLAEDAWESFSFHTHAHLENELADRGVDDVQRLPHYPYRDDGLLLWRAYQKFVNAYVWTYYKNEADVVNDGELKDFIRDLTLNGKVKDLSPATGNKIEKREDLARILLSIIWTSGPQHAAVNFPQWDVYGFMPNAPMSAYRKPPKVGDAPWKETDVIQMLPANAQVGAQITLMHFLGTQHYDRLGDYQAGHFWDAGIQGALQTLRQDLLDAALTIRERNALRPYRYDVLLPENVTNSTSV